MPTNLRVQFLGSSGPARQEALRAAAIMADGLALMGRPRSLHDATVLSDAAWDCPNVSVALEPATLGLLAVAPFHGLVVDTGRPACVIQERLNASAAVVAVDASGIAGEEGTDAVAALLGAMGRLMPCLNLERLSEALWGAYDRGFGYGARAAVRAFDLGYRQAYVATPSAAGPFGRR